MALYIQTSKSNSKSIVVFLSLIYSGVGKSVGSHDSIWGKTTLITGSVGEVGAVPPTCKLIWAHPLGCEPCVLSNCEKMASIYWVLVGRGPLADVTSLTNSFSKAKFKISENFFSMNPYESVWNFMIYNCSNFIFYINGYKPYEKPWGILLYEICSL